MNKKLAFLIGILAFFAMKMTAQEYKYGIYLGVSGSNMNITSDMYYDDSQVVTSTLIDDDETIYTVRYMPVDNASVSYISPLFTIGAYYELPVNEIIGLQVHLLFSRYGYTLKGTVDQPQINTPFSIEYDYKGELKMANLCIPILLKYNLANSNLSFQAGVTPSFCIRMQKEAECGTLHKTLNYKSDEFNPLNICGTIGATYYFLNNFMASLNFNIGLTDVLKVKEPYFEDPHDIDGAVKYRYTDTKSSTNFVSLTAGYRF